MKRPIALILLLSGSAGCTSESTDPVTEPDPNSAAIATVKALAGELTQGTRKLGVGDPAKLDETLELGTGHAVLEIEGAGTLRLYPKTKIRLAARQRTRLLAGKLWALVAGKSRDGFDVETDNAVCGVRGTRFMVSVAGGKTRVAVAAGKVSVKNRKKPDQEVVLGAGEEVDVVEDAPPTKPKPFDPAPEEKAWQQKELSFEPETIRDAPAAPTEAGPPPKPKVKVDRKAFEKHEKEGHKQKEELKKEDAKEKKKLEDEEKKNREIFEKGHKSIEDELEKDMGTKKRIEPKGTLKHERIKDKNSVKDLF